MTWPILAVISIISLSVATLFARVLMKGENSNPIGYAIVFQFILGTISLVLALIFGKFTLLGVENQIPRFVLSSLLWAGSTLFGFITLKRLNAGEAIILGSSSSVFAITLSLIFLGETLRLPAIAGIILIFASILIINTEKLSFNSRKGITFALIAALFSGIAVVNDAVILRSYEAFSYTSLMSFLPGLVLLLIFPKQIKNLGVFFNKKLLRLMTILCLLYSIQAISYYLAFQKGAPVSQLSPLTKSSIVLTVILAAIFLKERNNLGKKFLAATLVTIGALLLS